MMGTLSGIRMIVCGKGGSGKSTFVTLMAETLKDRGYEVHILDGDASNPGLHLMLGIKELPKPLIKFFGDVSCPVDDPTPIPKEKIPSSLKEIPSKYYAKKNGIVFFQVGKIEKAYQGCHGPESKITRDFIIPGKQVTLIDIEAGVEHFGRAIEVNADAIITVVDPTLTSFMIAENVKKMIEEMKKDVNKALERTERLRLKYSWTVLNKVSSKELESMMMRELRKRGIDPIGSIRYDDEIPKSCLEGKPLRESGAREDMDKIVDYIERAISTRR